MRVASMQDFSYDPFNPAVMADPLPYYRVLRDEHPVYYLDKWDTFALSRFPDIWDVLAVNDGTFVASEGTLPPASILARHNDGPVADPPDRVGACNAGRKIGAAFNVFTQEAKSTAVYAQATGTRVARMISLSEGGGYQPQPPRPMVMAQARMKAEFDAEVAALRQELADAYTVMEQMRTLPAFARYERSEHDVIN